MGLHNLPSQSWQVNAGWMLACNLAADLDAWLRLLTLHDQNELAHAEPDTMRFRLYHLPARLASHARRRHLVPLAEAWDSGASAWTAKEREAYANDLDDPRALIAVSAASNRSKGDKDPTEWLPPYAPYWCTYVTNWVADKTRYQLSVDPAEHTALAERLAACPDQPITITLAR